jgi:precorrin-3B methylase
MNGRASRERALRKENARMKAALSAIHDALHANEVDRAHELCECAIDGEVVTQPNISEGDAARGIAFAAQFNQLAKRAGLMACCITLVPSKTVANAVSLQLCGNVEACKVIEEMLRGRASTYMGDQAKGSE